MTRHVLILGGHGQISQLLTPILLRKSWTVTSVIRSQEQVPAIEKLAEGVSTGRLNVLVRSLEDVAQQSHAQAVLDEVKPDTIFWSAGAGGKGDPQRTYLIDRDAAVHFIKAAVATPSIRQFILVSYLASRRRKPSWWDDAAWGDAQQVNTVLARYYDAKIVADEELLLEAAKRRDGFAGISLRPGTLTADPAGKVEFGQTKQAKGNIPRASVAEVAAALMEKEGEVKSSWVDLLEGTEGVGEAVDRVVREGVDVSREDEVHDKLRG